MQLERLRLYNFKNYVDQLFDFHPQVNLIVGDNAMGKTNILDAIYFLAFTKSHANLTDAQLRRDQQYDYRVEALVRGSTGSSILYAGEFQQGKKTFYKQRNPYKKISEQIGEIPLVYVFPEEISIINDDASVRRRYLDQSISQFDRVYLKHISEYRKALMQRNALLKDDRTTVSAKHQLMDVLDQQIIALVPYISECRRSFVRELSQYLNEEYQSIANRPGEVVGLSLKSNVGEDAANFALLLERGRPQDFATGRSMLGPHRDDIRFELNGQLLRKYGSQGQLKSYLVALKLAHYQVFQEKLKFSPILLLDDIFDKLDRSRIENVLKNVFSKGFGQVFITTTDATVIKRIIRNQGVNCKVFTVEHGNIIDAHEEE